VAFEEILNDEDAEKGFQTQKALSYFQGILIELCEGMKIPYEIYVASAWKRTFGVKGRTRAEQKRSCREEVNKRFAVESEDACDSIGIGYHYFNRSNGPQEERSAF